jgi:hypothetical protein
MSKLIKTYGWIIVVVLSLLLVGAAWTAPDQAVSLERYVIAGGGRVAQGAYSLRNTFGQPVVGTSRGGNAELCAGFWCQSVEFSVYLPFVLKR